MRPRVFVVVAAMLVSAVALANRPVGYGYVTHVELEPYNPEVTRHGCTYEVALPTKRLVQAPEGPHPELLRGATRTSGTDPDPDGTCYKLEHTWQPVAFDRLHDRVQIAMPPATGFNFTAWFVTVSGAFLILPALFGGRYRRWRHARFERRMERRDRKFAALRERIQNKPPAPLPRAEVVDKGDH